MKKHRLLKIAVLTVIIVVAAAGAFWVVLDRFVPKKPGGIGTGLLVGRSLGSIDVRTLPEGSSTMALEELLPDDWKKRERRIVVEKSKRILTVYSGGKKVKSYFIALGGRPEGSKTRRDDHKTPEGEYYVCSKNSRSSYELSLLISYPGKKDAENGLKQGNANKLIYDKVCRAIERRSTPPQDTSLGGSICLHGGGIGAVSRDGRKALVTDWTLGCIAMRSADIREVFRFARHGTTVHILP